MGLRDKLILRCHRKFVTSHSLSNGLLLLKIVACLSILCNMPNNSIQTLGKNFEYDFRNAANDDNYINNKANTGAVLSIPRTAGTCDTSYSQSYDNICIRSNHGIYLNKGNQSFYITGFHSMFSSPLMYNYVNSLSARIYVNANISFIGALSNSQLLVIDSMLGWGIDIIYFTDPVKGIQLCFRPLTEKHYCYFSDLVPIISSSSWVDIVVTYTYVKLGAPLLDMQLKIFSSGWNNPLPQRKGETTVYNFDPETIYELTDFFMWNYHYIDLTIMYIS